MTLNQMSADHKCLLTGYLFTLLYSMSL